MGLLEGRGRRATPSASLFKLTRCLKADHVEVWALARATPCSSEAVLEVPEPQIRLWSLKSPSLAPDSLGEGAADAGSLTWRRPDRKRKGRGVRPPRPTGRVPRDSQNHKFLPRPDRYPAGATCVFRGSTDEPRQTQGRCQPWWPARPGRSASTASSLAHPPSEGRAAVGREYSTTPPDGNGAETALLMGEAPDPHSAS